jgi:valyl-tRNA synthetase
VEAMLNEAGVLKSVEEIPQNLPVAERGGEPVEQLPMMQWFVRVNKPFRLRQATLGRWKKGEQATLKELMREAVASKQVTILPDQFTKVYFHWIDNLRDWCISRQIWFGHRIPVWYDSSGSRRVSELSPGKEWNQDPDTLDTWFSSGSWTFTTLGWPDAMKKGKKTGDLKKYHPTDVLETGRDIIFFWVARMVMMSTYAIGEIPFKTVYLHGLVRDEQGRKMSKSLGNIINPLDVSKKFGTDAVRLSLVLGSSPGADTRLSEEKIAGFRNFTNKLWNISRFVLMSVAKVERVSKRPTAATLADRWILSRLDAVTFNATGLIERFEFSQAGDSLRDFTWTEFADWYLEIAKVQMQEATLKDSTEQVLLFVLENVLKLWHPFMPFVTEAIWDFLAGNASGKKFLMIESWPKAGNRKQGLEVRDFVVLQEVIGAIRNIRSEYKVDASKQVEVTLIAGTKARLLKKNAAAITTLARLKNLSILTKGQKPKESASALVGGIEIHLPLAGLVDPAREKARLEKERENLEGFLKGLEAKLGNPGYTEKAPKAVVDQTRQMFQEKQAALEKVRESLRKLG